MILHEHLPVAENHEVVGERAVRLRDMNSVDQHCDASLTTIRDSEELEIQHYRCQLVNVT